LQNELKKNLPASFIARFPQGVEVAFATIPIIPTLDSALRDEVKNTFGEALKVVWQMVLGISIAGFLLSLGMRQLELHTVIDDDWGRRDSDVAQRSDLEVLPQGPTTTEAIAASQTKNEVSAESTVLPRRSDGEQSTLPAAESPPQWIGPSP
jgi:hypothetical protein